MSGDIFGLFDGVTSLGQTSSVPSNLGLQIGSDFDAAFASPDFSSGVFELAAGTYSISGVVLQNADGFTGGGAGAALSSFNPTIAAVPLPAAGWLLLAGLAGIGLNSRRHKSA